MNKKMKIILFIILAFLLILFLLSRSSLFFSQRPTPQFILPKSKSKSELKPQLQPQLNEKQSETPKSSQSEPEPSKTIWGQKLSEEMRKFQPEGTVITLIHKGHSLIKKGDEMRSIEHVQILTHRPNGQNFSFDASVDSTDGSIISTWNRSIQD